MERWWDRVVAPKDDDQEKRVEQGEQMKHNILNDSSGGEDNGNGNESLHHRKVCYNRNPFFIKSEKLFKQKVNL